ncbi:hypothetical protein AGMMS49975_27590 [Clostridia bacterium]|nr:hypothetical protein AGMMS49975_27590 [Clostridia bacterium]
MDKNGRFFGKISIIDILFALLVVAGFVFLRGFAAPTKAVAGTGTPINYTVELQRKDTGFSDMIKTGETLFDSEKGYEIGTITEVTQEPFRTDVPDVANKIFRSAPADELWNVYVTVEANANSTERETAVGQYMVMVGKEVFVKSRSFASNGFVVKLVKE